MLTAKDWFNNCSKSQATKLNFTNIFLILNIHLILDMFFLKFDSYYLKLKLKLKFAYI